MSMTIDEGVTDKLRTIRIDGSIRSVEGMEQIAKQFDEISYECDSASHEVAAIALRYGVERIRELENRLARVSMELHS